MNRTIYFGPPGTGKTYTLLERMSESLRDGVAPDEIAFLTFTRRARYEATTRVQQELGIETRDLPYFRTIHSMAFRALKLKDGDVFARKHLKMFSERMGLEFGDVAASEQASEGIVSKRSGDVLLAIDNLARVRGQSLRETYAAVNRYDVEFAQLEWVAESYRAFKQTHGLLDFTDVLMEFVRTEMRLPVHVAFIDEAQDLSAIQWLAALQAITNAQEQYIAGDDDQAIYKWAGADVETFMTLPGNRIVLAHSHRLPSTVHTLASRLVRKITHRVQKEFSPRDAVGLVKRHSSITSIDTSQGEWLWLVRNRYLIPQLTEHLRTQHVVYATGGHSSVNLQEQQAIYDWERLRAGRAVEACRVRIVYSFLKTRAHIAHGHKLLPGVSDMQPLTLDDLKANHGLLIDVPWFNAFESITHERRSYYRDLMRKHKTLRLPVQVNIDTIHGAKGAEATRVALFTDMAAESFRRMDREADDEHRVWYVGATRAREELHVVDGASKFRYVL